MGKPAVYEIHTTGCMIFIQSASLAVCRPWQARRKAYFCNETNNRIMKRNLYFLLVSALLTACSGGADYLIKGSSKEFADGSKAYLFYFDTNDEPVFIDSTVCEKNSFAFSGVADTLKMAAVVVTKSPVDETRFMLTLYWNPAKFQSESLMPKRDI